MPAFVTMILSLAAELLRGVGDVASARRVEDILADRPKLSKVETAAYRRALARLAKR